MTLSTPGKLRFALSMFCLLAAFCISVTAQDKDWRPVTPAELSTKTSVVEPNADAEAIFWEVRVDDSSVSELALRHYVRVKIFTDKGREEFSKKDLTFLKGTKIKDVEARVTKPDGSNIFLKKEDVLEREIVRANGFKVKAKSFALPGLEAGSIVEYRYKEIFDNAEANMRLIFQRDLPIQTISYYIKPFGGSRTMYFERFNVGNMKPEKDKDGFYRMSMSNVPAFREEPNMLPEDEIRSWVYLYYSYEQRKDPQEYWKNISKLIYEGSKNSFKANDEVKAAAVQAIAGASGDEDKLKKIYEYTKTQIRNVSYAENVSAEDWKKVRNAKSAGDTLKLKMGSAGDIDQLFGAMARAAGFDARVALSGSRNELMFNPSVPVVELMLNSSSVAVKVGSQWRFFSPASYFTPFGMLSWIEEGQQALITDPKELIWEQIPLSPADRSVGKRTGKFKMLDDGTLEGDAVFEYSGHWAFYHKNLNRGDSTATQEQTLKDLIKRTISGTAEVRSFTIENVNDPEKPFIYRVKLRVPSFGTRTGRRMFFQPNIFEAQSKPRFTAAARKYDVYISYPWKEVDDVTIDLPTGFSLENADAPQPLKDAQGIGSHETTMGVTKDGKTLLYNRVFSFGNGGFIRFPVGSYGAVKQYFEAFNAADVHQLTLRQGATTAAVPGSSN